MRSSHVHPLPFSSFYRRNQQGFTTELPIFLSSPTMMSELSRQCCYLLHRVKKRKWVKAMFPDNWGREWGELRWGAIVRLKCNLQGQPVTRSIYTVIPKLLSSLLLTWGSAIKGNFHPPKFPLGQQCYNLLAYTNQPLWTLKALLRSLSLFFVLHAL